MYINIQFSESKFESIVRSYVANAVLTSSNLGLDGIQEIKFDPFDSSTGTEPGVIDHIEVEEIDIDYLPGNAVPAVPFTIFTPPGFVFLGTPPVPSQNIISINSPVVLCNIAAYVIRVADLEASALSQAPTSAYVKFDLQAVFQITPPTITGSNISLVFTPIQIRFGLGGNYIPSEDIEIEYVQNFANRLLQIMQNNAATWFPPVVFPINNLNSVFGSGYRVWNVGLRLNNGVIDLRLQIEQTSLREFFFISGLTYAPEWISNWTSYFSDSLTNRLNGLDWGVYFPFELFERRIADTVESSLAGRTNVVLNQRPTSQWNILGATSTGPCYPEARAAIRTQVAVHLPGACIPWGYDMDVNLNLTTNVTLSRPGLLRLDLVVSHEVDPGDTFVCGSLNALLTATGGVAIGGVFGGWIGAIVGGIVGGLAGGFTTLGLILEQDIPNIATSDLIAVEGAENTYYTEIEIAETTNQVLGSIAITRIFPCGDGLVAGGLLTELENNFEPLPDGNITVPRWIPPRRGQCPESNEPIPIHAEVGYNFFRSGYHGIIPLRIWTIEILEEDPGREFDGDRLVSGWTNPSIFTSESSIVTCYLFTPDLLNSLRLISEDGVPNLKVLFQTNAGARIFTLSVPSDQITDSQRTDLENEIRARCNANQDLIDSFEERTSRLRDLIHGPIPYFENINFDFIRWSLAFTGIPASTQIALRDNSGNTLATLDQKGQNLRSLDFWESDLSGKNPISLYYSGLGKQNSGHHPSFMVTSQRFRIIDKVSFTGSLTDHAVMDNINGVFCAILSNKHLTSYKMSAGGRLLMSSIISSEGIVSLRSFAGKICAQQRSGAILASTNGSLWEEIKIEQDGKISTENLQIFQEKTTCYVQSENKIINENISSASHSKRYALLLNDEANALHFMERLDMASGGYLNPKSLSEEKPNPEEKDGCNPFSWLMSLFKK
tara:strand:+ start:202237 stop:205080 length:2844 start_codon:yes stop_codon:yes gene_type:complete